MVGKPRSRLVLFILVFALLAACQPREQEPFVIPTLMELPTVTPTDTPSRTPLPTWTDTPTPTETPTITPSYTLTPSNTFTPTFTPTFTLTPSPTLTPSETLRPTLTPSPTRTPTDTATPLPTATNTPRPTFTPVPTQTPIPTATPDLPVIFSFTPSLFSATPGTPIVLTWASNGELARVEQLNTQGVITQTFPPAPPTSQLSVVVPGNLGPQVIYRLVVTRGGREVSQSVPVQIICTVPWFFGNQFAPPDAGCPPAVGAITNGAFQRFERGLMIYVPSGGQNRIYGLQDEGSRYLVILNQWDGVTERTDPAPSGLFIPQQMFNWAYYNTLAPTGTWNSAIGWAIMPIDLGPRTIQFENAIGGSNPFYIDTPDGAVYRFSGGDSGTWTRIR